tara:strand:+ start:767 stop:1627 length:861 start_codon:yes stop_codon:yes gene_type:complete
MATWKKVLTVSDIDTDTTFGSSSNSLVPSQLAVKTYVDAQVDTADALSELNDVTISSVGDNEVLAYDNSSSKFINQTASEAGLQTALTFGTANGNSLKVVTGIGADVDANDFAVFTNDHDQAGGGLKGLSAQEVRTAISAHPSGGGSSLNFDANNLTVAGDLTVTGTTISSASENILIEDSVMTLNSGVASGNTAIDGGFIVERGTNGATAGLVTTDGNNVGFGFDESAGYFGFSSGSSTSAFNFVAGIPTATNHATNTAPSNDDIGPIGSIHVATDSDSVYIRVA